MLCPSWYSISMTTQPAGAMLHQEMTPEEAELRNRQLQSKGSPQQWILCEDYESTGCCTAQSGRLETVR